ncbi:MAG: dephospho-CoA kinase [Acidobacteriota bacterium]|nr:MAG: dephospho-CoA kinase [Acidobacteriota bacterium]
MLKVGLTGSIAVGKSYVCECFRELGCHVLDADLTARKVVEPGTPGLARIVEEFGNGVLLADGSLDRKRLGSVVFGNEEKRLLLNSIVHPLVIDAQDRWLKDVESKQPGGIAIIDAALMIESGGYKRFNKLIVVWCKPDIQLQRLTSRDGLTAEEAIKRISSQMPQEEKKRYADFLIDTSHGFEDTQRQVRQVFSSLNEIGSTESKPYDPAR